MNWPLQNGHESSFCFNLNRCISTCVEKDIRCGKVQPFENLRNFSFLSAGEVGAKVSGNRSFSRGKLVTTLEDSRSRLQNDLEAKNA
jgi:hypothetical protein